nr:hypothetical protein [Lachnospiraceae bacterium]
MGFFSEFVIPILVSEHHFFRKKVPKRYQKKFFHQKRADSLRNQPLIYAWTNIYSDMRTRAASGFAKFYKVKLKISLNYLMIEATLPD